MATPVSNHQFMAFGQIIYMYANVEIGIKLCLAGILRMHPHDALTIAAPYSATHLENVAKSTAKQYLKPELAKEFCDIIGRWKSRSSIRTAIAHHRWRKGGRDETIKPTHYDVRAGKLKIRGFDDDETDYTAEELFKIALELNDTNQMLVQFFNDSGLAEIVDAIEKKTADNIMFSAALEGMDDTESSS